MVSSTSRLVERLYEEVWNKADGAVAGEILDPGLRFRSSLGLDLVGLAEFIGCMRSIHAALADYTCIIEDLIATEHRAAARLRFTVVHRGLFFGVAPTFREITWGGAAFFTTDRGRIMDLWVLGDVDAVKRQLGQRRILPWRSRGSALVRTRPPRSTLQPPSEARYYWADPGRGASSKTV
jgi:predicted ester cyclase